MKKETLKKIFDFLEEKGEHNTPIKWKLVNNEPLTDDDLDVKGDLDLSGSQITSLPEGLKITGNLDLSYSKITSLPEGLTVTGYLALTETDIEFLPKGLVVGDDLYITWTNLTEYTYDEIIKMIEPGSIEGGIVSR